MPVPFVKSCKSKVAGIIYVIQLAIDTGIILTLCSETLVYYYEQVALLSVLIAVCSHILD